MKENKHKGWGVGDGVMPGRVTLVKTGVEEGERSRVRVGGAVGAIEKVWVKENQ